MLTRYRGRHPLHSYLSARRDPIAFFSDVVRESGDFAAFRVMGLPYVLINDPALIREALVEKSETLIIKGGTSAGLARLIGHGILTNRGDDWYRSRTGLKPTFQPSSLKSYVPAMSERVDESFERWRTRFAHEPMPIARELLALSFRITCSTLFGYLPGFEEAEELAEAVRVLQRDGMDRYSVGGDFMAWLPLPRNRRIARAKATLVRLARTAVERGSDQPVDEILSLLFAGTESVVNSVCFALKLLEDHPQWREQAVTFAGRVSGETTLDDLERFDLLAQIMSESMRLFPAGWAFERYASEDVLLGGERVAKGTRLMFSPFVLHRNPRFWREPERFDPLRFTTSPSNVDGVPKYGYLPFGAGPRSCIGARFALAQMRLIFVALLARCRWRSEVVHGEAPLAAEGAFKIRLSRPLRLEMEFV